MASTGVDFSASDTSQNASESPSAWHMDTRDGVWYQRSHREDTPFWVREAWTASKWRAYQRVKDDRDRAETVLVATEDALFDARARIDLERTNSKIWKVLAIAALIALGVVVILLSLYATTANIVALALADQEARQLGASGIDTAASQTTTTSRTQTADATGRDVHDDIYWLMRDFL